MSDGYTSGPLARLVARFDVIFDHDHAEGRLQLGVLVGLGYEQLVGGICGLPMLLEGNYRIYSIIRHYTKSWRSDWAAGPYA
jgi:hypothetical protein